MDYLLIVLAIVLIGMTVIAISAALMSSRRRAEIDEQLAEDLRRRQEWARQSREMYMGWDMAKDPDHETTAEKIRRQIREHDERRRREDDDGFDHTGFAIGLATGMPLSPSRGMSSGAMLGAAFHQPQKHEDYDKERRERDRAAGQAFTVVDKDVAPPASYSPPEPSCSPSSDSSSSSSSSDSSSSSSCGGGDSGGGGGGGGD